MKYTFYIGVFTPGQFMHSCYHCVFYFIRGLPIYYQIDILSLFRDRIYGRIGDAIDIFYVIATLFGLATL
jgi:choline-glycine betaine transporter